MSLRNVILVPAVLALSVPAAAQSAPDGFFIDGYAEIESLHTSNDDDNFSRANFDLGFEPSSTASNLPIGFTLGIDSVHGLGFNENAIYGALTYRADFGKFSLGAPRGVADDYLDFPPVGGLRALDLEITPVGSMGLVSFFALSHDTPYGLRYDGTFGQFDVGAAYHRFTDGDVDAYGLALRYRFNDMWKATGTIEHATPPGSSITRYAMAVEGESERLKGGLRYVSSDFGSSDINAVNGYLTYTPVERLDLTVSAINVESGGSTTIYGLDGRYTSTLGAYVAAGIADSSNSFSTIYNVSVGWEF